MRQTSHSRKERRLTIGLDMDGVLCRQIEWPFMFPTFLFQIIRVLIPAMSGIEIARKLGRRHRLVIVSCRSPNYWGSTCLWLWSRRIPFNAVHCIGIDADKGDILRAEKVDIFFDNQPHNIEAAENQEIRSILFQNWNHTAKEVAKLEAEFSATQT